MSKDIALQDNNQGVEISHPAETSTALHQQVQAMADAHKLATALANTSMVPAAYKGKPDDAAVAILYGQELGLPPHAALQNVFVVQGKPAIYARTMAALLMRKGYTFTTVESTNEAVTVTGRSPQGMEETSTWTIDRAKQAGYTSNKKYQTDPQAMLYAKALTEVARKIAPDVLLGIAYSREELELEQPLKATARRVDRPKTAGSVKAALGGVKPSEHPPVQDEAPGLLGEERALLDEIKQELGGD